MKRVSECPAAACRHSLSEYRPAAPAEESSFPRTSGSRACRGCSADQPRTPRSTAHPLQPLLVRLHPLEGFPDLPFGDLERLCLARRLLLFPVDLRPRLNNAAPSLQPHYRAFVATTGCSVPAPRIGISPSRLEPLAACPFASGSRFSRSIRQPDRASRRLHAGCRSVGLRTSSELIPEEGSPPGFGIA